MLARKLTAASARAAVAPWWLAGGAPEPVAVYQPIGAASLAASYVNLANPGVFDAAPGVAPTFSAVTGWGFNGTTQYLTTGVVPSSSYTIIVRVMGVSNAGYAIGQFTSNRNIAIAPQGGTGQVTRWLYGFQSHNHTSGTPDGTIGLAAGNRYVNGAGAGSFSTVTFTATRALFVGAINNVDPFLLMSGNIQAIAIYDTSTDHAVWVPAVSAAMAAL